MGVNSGTILACYTTGSVNAGDGMEGAIAGENANNYGGTITACYWSGNMAQGVGNALTEGATKVEGNVTWDTAMTETPARFAISFSVVAIRLIFC